MLDGSLTRMRPAQRLTDMKTPLPTVASNGKRLAFERIDHKRGKQAIFIIRLDGTGARRRYAMVD